MLVNKGEQESKTTFERLIHAACINYIYSLYHFSVSAGHSRGCYWWFCCPCRVLQLNMIINFKDIDVYWVYSGSTNVFDIIKGKDSVEGQDPLYKNKTETFPDEYERGNFSLKLINLQHSDAGKYTCFITPSDELQTVELIIKGV